MKNKKEIWYDARELDEKEIKTVLPVVINSGFDSIMIEPSQKDIIETLSNRVGIIFAATENNIAGIIEVCNVLGKDRKIIVFSEQIDLLKKMKKCDVGILLTISDRATMNKCIELSNSFKNVMISFEHTTNIPLELVLAFSQKNNSRVCKIVNSSDDGWIATMTMEMGSYAVLLKSVDVNDIAKLSRKINENIEGNEKIKEFKVTNVKHIGMGDRVCIDTVSYLEKDEGMIIGSTSSGGLLVSSETHYLPYMDLRPFRVNAGAIHSYVWCPNNTTKYLSELKVGDEVLVFNSKGEKRIVSVGRVKIEKRPLLLIEAECDGRMVNTIVQDDWHIRIILPDGGVMNSTELKKDSKILGLSAKAGRHLGVEIEETITEK